MGSKNKIKDNRSDKCEKLPVKVFKQRSSYLTELVEQNIQFQHFYTIFFCLVLLTVISTAIANYKKENKFYLGSEIIVLAFRNFDVAFVIWVGLFFSSILVYVGFMGWAITRKLFRGFTKINKLWDLLWLVFYVFYLFFLFYYSCKYVIVYDLGVASSLAVLLETTRFSMKAHAFVRSNCSKYLEKCNKQVNPTICHYLYFSFAPTLIYEDFYPRTNKPIRWNLVFKYLTKTILGFFFFSIVYDNSFRSSLKDCGLKPYSWLDIIIIQVQNMYAAMLLVITLFYFGFHCYLNAAAEMLRFSDRLFYKDWWVSKSLLKSVRDWNLFVHSWLYIYVYKECCDNVFKKNKFLSKLTVFFVSAIFHDLIIGFSSRVYMPLYSVGIIVTTIVVQFFDCDKKINSTWFWLIISFSASGQLTFLTAQYFAQLNCPLKVTSFFDYFQISFLNC